MTRPIAYDIMRLFIGPSFVNPRGIDRVDLALATQIFSEADEGIVGVLPTPVGVYAYPASQVRKLLAYVRDRWAEDTAVSADPQLQWLIDRLTNGPHGLQQSPLAKPLTLADKSARMFGMIHATGLYPRRLAVRAVPYGASYLNVGQLGLAMPAFFNWLDKRPDVTCAAMVHDAIPIEHPELVSEKATRYHERMIDTAARRADGLIYNSAFTQESVTAVIRRLGHPCPPSLVRALPLPGAFASADTSIPALADIRYFISVSTIEPRKNFALLLRVWQQLIADMGAAAPHLVIAGAPGRDADSILAPLQSDARLAAMVHHVVGLSSPALAALVLGAAGVLSPTVAEGFGLPLLEAHAMGVPTIASDIPAHRELATAITTLLRPDDDAGWSRAIKALPTSPMRTRPDIPDSMTDAAYCADIVDFIRSISPQRA